jgi:hypothetical protein
MKAEIYTRAGCCYCVAAEQLMVKRNLSFVEKDVSRPEVMAELNNATLHRALCRRSFWTDATLADLTTSVAIFQVN